MGTVRVLWHPQTEHLVSPPGFCTRHSLGALISRSPEVGSQSPHFLLSNAACKSVTGGRQGDKHIRCTADGLRHRVKRESEPSASCPGLGDLCKEDLMAKQLWSCTQRQPTVSVPAQEFGLCPQEPGMRDSTRGLGSKKPKFKFWELCHFWHSTSSVSVMSSSLRWQQ